MALQGSGQISFLNLQTEFGGANPIYLSEYYRGGAYVPNTPTNSGVATEGLISLAQFYNTSVVSGPTVAMPDAYPTIFQNGGSATAQLILGDNGTWSATGGGSGTWLTSGSVNDLQVIGQITDSGDGTGTFSGTIDAWIDCTPTKTWSLSRAITGTSTRTMLLTFRNKNTLAHIDTASIFFDVTRDTPL